MLRARSIVSFTDHLPKSTASSSIFSETEGSASSKPVIPSPPLGLVAPSLVNVFFAWARRESGKQVFKPWELVLAVALVGVAVFAAYQMWTGAVSPL